MLVLQRIDAECGDAESRRGDGHRPLPLTVTGMTPLTRANQMVQLTATATLSDGTTQNVTGTAGWQSLAASIATVSADGRTAARCVAPPLSRLISLRFCAKVCLSLDFSRLC